MSIISPPRKSYIDRSIEKMLKQGLIDELLKDPVKFFNENMMLSIGVIGGVVLVLVVVILLIVFSGKKKDNCHSSKSSYNSPGYRFDNSTGVRVSVGVRVFPGHIRSWLILLCLTDE